MDSPDFQWLLGLLIEHPEIILPLIRMGHLALLQIPPPLLQPAPVPPVLQVQQATPVNGTEQQTTTSAANVLVLANQVIRAAFHNVAPAPTAPGLSAEQSTSTDAATNASALQPISANDNAPKVPTVTNPTFTIASILSPISPNSVELAPQIPTTLSNLVAAAAASPPSDSNSLLIPTANVPNRSTTSQPALVVIPEENESLGAQSENQGSNSGSDLEMDYEIPVNDSQDQMVFADLQDEQVKEDGVLPHTDHHQDDAAEIPEPPAKRPCRRGSSPTAPAQNQDAIAQPVLVDTSTCHGPEWDAAMANFKDKEIQTVYAMCISPKEFLFDPAGGSLPQKVHPFTYGIRWVQGTVYNPSKGYRNHNKSKLVAEQNKQVKKNWIEIVKETNDEPKPEKKVKIFREGARRSGRISGSGIQSDPKQPHSGTIPEAVIEEPEQTPEPPLAASPAVAHEEELEEDENLARNDEKEQEVGTE